MKQYVIGIDGGGTKTAAALANSSGDILGWGESGPSNYHAVGIEAAFAALDRAITVAWQQAGLKPELPAAMGIGLAGVDRPRDRQLIEGWAAERYAGVPLRLVNDAQLVLAAGTADNRGVAVIAGTGSIVIGQDPAGNTARAGGWGYLLGDEGSGYQVGLAALQAAARAWDGRAAQTSLTGRLLEFYGIQTPPELIAAVYRPENSRPEIARLARLVDEEAQNGDPAAREIIAAAGRELVLTVQAVIAKLHLSAPVPAALAGGFLLQSAALQSAFQSSLAQMGVILNPVCAVEKPVLGAVCLALRSLRGTG